MFDLAISIASLSLSIVSLILSTIAIAVIVGFKNSTHKIEWKPLPTHEDDPFKLIDDDLPFENPNKRKIKNPFPKEEVKEDESFVDLDDPNETSANW